LGARRDGTNILFEVSDTGPGIPPEQLSHLFEQFWQARKNDKRGVGLGLTIAKGIVEAHGGRIWVTSTPGEGSTFAFTIPAGDRA
jgi:signal transduction histidine kinase